MYTWYTWVLYTLSSHGGIPVYIWPTACFRAQAAVLVPCVLPWGRCWAGDTKGGTGRNIGTVAASSWLYSRRCVCLGEHKPRVNRLDPERARCTLPSLEAIRYTKVARSTKGVAGPFCYRVYLLPEMYTKCIPKNVYSGSRAKWCLPRRAGFNSIQFNWSNPIELN